MMGAKGLEYAAYTAAVMITLVNFLSVVTVERFVGMKSGWWSLLIRFGQPVDSGLCTGDGFQHFSFEVT